MDAHRFDTLIRSLDDPSSRRGVVRGLCAVTLGLLGTRWPSAATARKKRKNGKKGKNAKKCKRGAERCQGTCVKRCPSGQVRNPATCGCCRVTGGFCSPAGASATCCSEICAQILEATQCAGRNPGQQCEFNAQCESEFCNPAGLCAFAAP